DLADGALGAGREVACGAGADAAVGPGADLFLAPQLDDAGADERVVPAAGQAGLGAAAGEADEVGGADAADAFDADGAAAGDHLAFAGEGGLGDAPAVAGLADAVRVGDHGAVEEHLEELGLAADVGQRPHLDAGLAHGDEEVRDALVLGGVGVGTGEQHGVVGLIGPGRPDLL